MRKRVLVMLIAGLLVAGGAQAYDGERSEKGFWGRLAEVEMRGFSNLLGAPAELVRTPVAEAKQNGWLAVFTSVPATLNNIFIRAFSGFYDAGIYPFRMFFTRDTMPLTDPMGLPDYPWQIREYDF